MLELAGVLPEILKLGAAGLFIVYLAWALSESRKENTGVRKELADCQEARLRDLKTIVGEMQGALTTSSEVIRAINGTQAIAGQSAANIATVVESFQSAIERVESRINELASRRHP